MDKLKVLKRKLDLIKANSEKRSSLSSLNLNSSIVDDRNSKKRKLPFELLQEENRM